MQKNFYKNLWQLLAPTHKSIKWVLLLIVVIQSVALVAPYLLKIVIDLIINLDPSALSKIITFVIAIFLVEQINSLLRAYNDKVGIRIWMDMEKHLSIITHEKMVNLSLSYHEKENTGNKISKIQKGISSILGLLTNSIFEIAPTLFKNIVTLIVLFFVDFRFGILFLFFVPLFIVLSLKFNRVAAPLRKKRYNGYEKAAGIMAQSIININTVKSFAKESEETHRFKQSANKIFKNQRKEFSIKIKYGLGKDFIVDLGKTAIMLFGLYLIMNNSITIGTFVFAYTISDKALISLYRVSRLYDKIMESSEGVSRLSALLQEEVQIKSPKKGISPKKIKGNIEFKNVNFSYDSSGVRALSKVSASIKAGEFIALVGPSGGGKTTLARMIYRHYDPQEGQILLDGLDLKEYNLYAIRRRMAIVPQEVELFDLSVKDNIAYSNKWASISQIKKAAEISNSSEFIKGLTNGYETLIGERGMKLSGGQRQRIGIARAVLANPDILIFDEATSALDSESEKLIQDSLSRISKNRTTIVIAHRLSTIQKADTIIVLEKGRVVEVGNHASLAKEKTSLYARLHKLQKMGEIA